jgi:hypothetical protein
MVCKWLEDEDEQEEEWRERRRSLRTLYIADSFILSFFHSSLILSLMNSLIRSLAVPLCSFPFSSLSLIPRSPLFSFSSSFFLPFSSSSSLFPRTFSSKSSLGLSLSSETFFSDLFATARLDVEDSLESLGTTYFSEDLENARRSVDHVIREYERILDELNETEKRKMKESWSMRIEQLKQELQEVIKKSAED